MKCYKQISAVRTRRFAVKRGRGIPCMQHACYTPFKKHSNTLIFSSLPSAVRLQYSGWEQAVHMFISNNLDLWLVKKWQQIWVCVLRWIFWTWQANMPPLVVCLLTRFFWRSKIWINNFISGLSLIYRKKYYILNMFYGISLQIFIVREIWFETFKMKWSQGKEKLNEKES